MCTINNIIIIIVTKTILKTVAVDVQIVISARFAPQDYCQLWPTKILSHVARFVVVCWIYAAAESKLKQLFSYNKRLWVFRFDFNCCW